MLSAIIALAAAGQAAPTLSFDGELWEMMSGSELEWALYRARIHDPDCPTDDHCDEVFLDEGKYLRSVGPEEERRLGSPWARGWFRIGAARYCVVLPRRAQRCFALFRNADGGTLRIELDASAASPTRVQLLPASRGGWVYP